MSTPIDEALKKAKEEIAKKLPSSKKIIVYISGNLEYTAGNPNVVFTKVRQ